MSRRKQGIVPKKTDGGEETEEIVKNGDHSLTSPDTKGELLSLQMLNECKKCLCEYVEKCQADELGKLSQSSTILK